MRVRTIGNDFYNYSQKEYALIGQRTKKKYALGDSLRVKLVCRRLGDAGSWILSLRLGVIRFCSSCLARLWSEHPTRIVSSSGLCAPY